MSKRTHTKILAKALRFMLCASFLSWLYLLPSSSAQSQIQCGQVTNGSISASGEEDRYTFSASAGDVVTLRLVTTTSNFSALMLLLNPSNQQIGSSSSPAKITQTLTQSGVYTIVVKRNSGNQTGGYQLTWQQAKNPCNSTPIAVCQTIRASLEVFSKLKKTVNLRVNRPISFAQNRKLSGKCANERGEKKTISVGFD